MLQNNTRIFILKYLQFSCHQTSVIPQEHVHRKQWGTIANKRLYGAHFKTMTLINTSRITRQTEILQVEADVPKIGP